MRIVLASGLQVPDERQMANTFGVMEKLLILPTGKMACLTTNIMRISLNLKNVLRLNGNGSVIHAAMDLITSVNCEDVFGNHN